MLKLPQIFTFLLTLLVKDILCQDIYGVVSIQNITDFLTPVFTVTSNDDGGNISVYLVAVNESSNGLVYQPEIAIDEGVLVSCSVITPYSAGDSVVEFLDYLIPRGDTEADVFFNVTQQGRAVEVQCSGQGQSDGTTNLFDSMTSAGPTGMVVVKKSPIVSFCDPVVQVPYANQISSGTVTLKLSEPVRLYDVTVSCEIVGVLDVNNSLSLTFHDGVVSPGMDSINMEYTIQRHGSVVLVACTAQSLEGNQYLSSTSSSSQVPFILDSGSVQLVPSVSNIHSPTFSAFLVLSETLQADEGEITFICNLVPVNTTEFARETIENPNCVFSQPVQPSSTPSPPPGTQCPVDANSTCPTSSASPVTSPTPNVSLAWSLLTSEFVFEEGDLFKEIQASLNPPEGSYKGALVLSCCAAYDVNSSPKYTNASAALLMLSDVKPTVGVNVSSVPVQSIGAQESEILNPAYVEVSPCPCDLQQNGCDTDCCCDIDCSQTDLEVFTCMEGIPGGNFSGLPDYLCGTNSLYHPDFSPLLCVQVSNSPYLGLYYSTLVGLEDISSFNSLKSQSVTSATTSFEDTSSRDLDYDETMGNLGYSYGYPIELLYESSVRGYLTLPEVAFGGECLYSSPVKFQQSTSSHCTHTLEVSQCADYTPFSARMYLQSSSTSYPPCPPVPQVVSSYGQPLTVSTSVSYFCLENIEFYSKSTLDYELNATKTELFGEDESNEYDTNMTRCEWDDGFSVPLVPTYNNDTKSCDNVVLDVHYQLFWQGAEIVEIEVTILVGSVPVPGYVSPTDVEDNNFVSPPPTPELITDIDIETVETDAVVTVTEFLTDFGTDLNGFLMSLGTDKTIPPATSVTLEGPQTNTTTTTTPLPVFEFQNVSSVQPTTQPLSTSPVLETPFTPTPTVPVDTIPTTQPENVTVNGTVLPINVTILPSDSPTNESGTTPDNDMIQTDALNITQLFRVTFTHMPEEMSNPDTGIYESPPPQYQRSGNPGYIIGAAVFSGVAVYEPVDVPSTSPTPANCSADPLDPSCNETETVSNNTIFSQVRVTDGNRLQIIYPGVSGLCSEASVNDIYFGENVLSGCFLRLSLSDLANCTELRMYMMDQLEKYIPSDLIGKTGDPDVLQESDWAKIFKPADSLNLEPENTSTTAEPATSQPPMTTEYPNQTYIQDPTPPQILDQLSGICFDVPTGVNVEIMITDAGEFNGFVIQEIVSARVSYTASVIQMNCVGANAVRCQTNNITGTQQEYVQSFMVTSSVTFTKVPAVSPEPVILYYKDYNPTLCKQDTCLRELFYPFSESFQGDNFTYSLAVTLLTVIITTGYLIITKPWLGFSIR